MAREGFVYLCAPHGTDLCDGRVLIGDRSFSIIRYKGLRNHFYPDDAVSEIYRLTPEDIRPWIRSTAFSVGTNIANDWVLNRYPTHYVQIRKPAIEQRFVFAGPASRKVPLAQGKYLFSGYFAAHRASAAVVVSVIGADGHLLHRDEAHFDTTHGGGRLADGYRKVELEFDVCGDNCRLGVEMIYFRPPSRSQLTAEPYLFFAGCSVTRSGDALVNKSPRPDAVFSGDLGCISGGDLFVSSIDPSAFSADICRIDLDHGGRVGTILKIDTAPVSLADDVDGMLNLSATSNRTISLYVDGAFTETLMVGAHQQFSQIDTRFRDGRPHHLMIRDLSGTARLYDGIRTWPTAPAQVREAESQFVASNSMAFVPPAGDRYRAKRDNPGSAYSGVLSDGVQLDTVISALESGPDANTNFVSLRFRAHPEPDVSVIIPAHNQFAVTYHCLCALLIASNAATFEIILVDDGSTDETKNIGDIVSGITIVRQDTAQRFLRACNRGALHAKAPYIVLLNNDTEPLDGWLDELLRVYRDHPDAGLVGSKLFYPDRRLQEAGGIIFASGDPANYGRGDYPYDPKYCYVRQADYVSGASMMTPKAVWEELGGFSSYLEPMYFEDTDYALKVRESGRTVWFTPFSRVVHFEGKTSGADTKSGMKRYQEVNRPKFKQRWRSALTSLLPGGADMDLVKDGSVTGRVIFLDAETPQPNRDAGSYAAVNEMELVQALGYKVTFVPQNMAWFGPHTEALQRRGIEVLYHPFYESVAEVIEKRGPHTDAFFITRYQVAQRHIDDIRRIAPQAKVLFNLADLHFLREMRSALASGDRDKLERARRIRAAELEVIRSADLTLSYSEIEQAIISSLLMEDVSLIKCPWVVEKVKHTSPFEARKDICFLGNFGHPPNEEGLQYFSSEVMPGLVKTMVDLRLHVYGSGMQDRHKQMASSSVIIKGYVESLGEAFGAHRIFVAPLLSGAGIKGKVLAALSHGIPVVLSPHAAEGIGLQDGSDCLIAEDVADWISAISRIYDDEDLWTKISTNGLRLIERRYSFANGRRMMKAAFDRAGVERSVSIAATPCDAVTN